MLNKIIGFFQVWIGLTFVASLFGFIPGVGPAIASVINQILSFASILPFYVFLLAFMGTAVFVDGILRLMR